MLLTRKGHRKALAAARFGSLCVLAGTLPACTAGPESTSATTTAMSSAARVNSSSGASPGSPSGASPGASSAAAACAQLEVTGAAITKTVHELSLLIGTEQDPTSVLEDVAGFAPTLGGLVPACVPDAEESMWRFLGSTETLRQKFSSAADKTEMRATKVALISVRAHAEDLYRRLGLDGAAWSEVPASARPACRDLPSIAARVTWDVRHLANLIGSDNGKDAQDYLIEISALGAAMADLVGECHPGAVPAMAEFSGAVEQLSSTYRPGSIAAEVEADKAALGNLREKGRALYSAVGVSAASWDVIPSTER